MQLAVIGLGRMGGNIARRLMRGGHELVVFNRHWSAVEEFVAEGAVGATDLDDLVAKLKPPRTVWVMLPAGEMSATTM